MTLVKYELSQMTLLSISCRSSEDRAPARCSGGHGFDSVGVSAFFFAPRSCHVDQFTFHNLVLLYVTRTSKVRVTTDSRMGYVTLEES